MRDVALVSGAGVSSASFVAAFLRLLASHTALRAVLDCPPCPLCPDLPPLDLSSVLVGIGIGVLLLPALEAFWLLRAALFRRLASRLQADALPCCPWQPQPVCGLCLPWPCISSPVRWCRLGPRSGAAFMQAKVEELAPWI